jgi:hypothetical protein
MDTSCCPPVVHGVVNSWTVDAASGLPASTRMSLALAKLEVQLNRMPWTSGTPLYGPREAEEPSAARRSCEA